MDTQITEQKKLRGELQKHIREGKAASNLHFLSFLAKNQFEGLTETARKKVEKWEFENMTVADAAPTDETPFLEFFLLPPFSNREIDVTRRGVSIDPAHDCPLYQTTSFVDKENGEIYLSVLTGKIFTCVFPYVEEFELGYRTRVCGGLRHEITLPFPTSMSLLLKATAFVKLPDCDIQEICLLFPGSESAPLHGLCGVTGDFHLAIGGRGINNELIFLNRRESPFVHAYSAAGNALNHTYEKSLEVTLVAEIPAGVSRFTINMNAHITASTSQGYTIEEPGDVSLNLALLDFRKPGNSDYPIFPDSLGHSQNSRGGIKVEKVKLELFPLLRRDDDNGTH